MSLQKKTFSSRHEHETEKSGEFTQEFTLLPQLCHEVRSPLLGMQGLIQRLTEDYAQDLYLVEHLRLLGVSLEQVLSVTENTLTFSQLQNNRLPIHEDALFLPDWLRDTLTLLKPLAYDKNLSLSWKISLPDSAQWVTVDKVRLTQIVNNLVTNAVKFTKYGGVSVKLETRLFGDLDTKTQKLFKGESASTERLYCLQVEDSGVGMSPEQVAKIFGAYRQGEKNAGSENTFGLGLGLSIVKSLVRQMSGVIQVQSFENEGSTFTVYLPLQSSKPQDIFTPPSSLRLSKGHLQAASKMKRVLVADDSAINRKVLENQLIQLGCEVFHARNGEEAVACVQKRSIDVVFMDIQMPIMDGVCAAQKIRAFQSVLPSADRVKALYALTAGGEAVDLMAREAYPHMDELFTQWLSKPIEWSQLTELLQASEASNNTSVGKEPLEKNALEGVPEHLKHLYPEFILKMQQQKNALQHALNAQNEEETKRLVHGMKGDAMVFQHERWIGICQDIEKLLKQQPVDWQTISHRLGA